MADKESKNNNWNFLPIDSLKIGAKYPDGNKRMLINFCPHKTDGTLLVSCPRKYLKANEYRFGTITFPAGVKGIPEWKLNEENGFVVQKEKIPKISLHPNGRINISLSSGKDAFNSRAIEIGKILGELGAKTICTFSWSGVHEFEENPHSKTISKEFFLELDASTKRICALLDVSNSIFDLLNINKEFTDQISIADVPFGKLLVLEIPLMIEEKRASKYISGNNGERVEEMVGVFFGLRFQERILWYLLRFIPPEYTDQSIQESAYFQFEAGFQNFEIQKTREPGSKLVLIGQKDS
jgi:hypothetical protein